MLSSKTLWHICPEQPLILQSEYFPDEPFFAHLPKVDVPQNDSGAFEAQSCGHVPK